MPKGGKSLGGFKVVLVTSVPVCACVPACACLCLWPVAGSSMPDIISPKGSRPASKSRLVFSMYIFRIPQSLPGYLASAADCFTWVVLRETESAPPASQSSIGFRSCRARIRELSFHRSSMGPCSLLVYQVILVSVLLCTPALLACCSARTLGAWALFLFARASALCSCSSLVLPL